MSLGKKKVSLDVPLSLLIGVTTLDQTLDQTHEVPNLGCNGHSDATLLLYIPKQSTNNPKQTNPF